MRQALRVDPSDPVPIWRQIEEGMRRQMLSGGMPPGTLVPPVRELAKALRVNPAMVFRAYQRLDAEVQEGARRYGSVALTAGLSLEEAQGTDSPGPGWT